MASVIAVAGVCCATAVMIVTMAVTLGFKREIRQKLAGFTAQISVSPPYNYSRGVQEGFLSVDSRLLDAVRASVGPEARAVEVMRQPGIIKTGDDYSALVFHGYGPGHDWSFERSCLTEGSLPAPGDSLSLVFSDATARKLDIHVGDRVTAVFFADGSVKSRRFTVSGLFTSNFADYDRTVCYAPIGALRDIAGVSGSQVSALEVRGLSLSDGEVAERAEALQQVLLDYARRNNLDSVPIVDNITRSGAMYLNWLDMLDTNVAVIFVIMCCVAAFTLVSSLFIVILNGVPVIGVLRAMGMDGHGVRRVYVLTTMRLVGSGVVLGCVVALALVFAQWHWRFVALDPEMYYLSAVPVYVDWLWTVCIAVGVAVAGWLVLILPARLASSVPAARSMRYE